MGPMQYIGAGLALAVAFLSMYIMILRGDIEVFEEREKNWQGQLDTLNETINGHENAAVLAQEQATAGIKRIADFEADQRVSRAETQRMLGMINELRATEAREALFAPYERGLAAGVRINRSLQRLSTNSRIPDGDITSGHGTDDSSGAEPNDSGTASPDGDNP